MITFPEEARNSASDMQALWKLPIGAASPLWAAYATMASAGVAYWWMSQWMRPVNLEAFKWGQQLPTVPASTTGPAVIVDNPLAQTLAALQPEPVATPDDPVIEPEAPEAKLAEASFEAASAAAEAVGEAAISASLSADDLTRLVGIGPSLAGRLSNLGIRTFADIASWTDEDLEKMDKVLDLKGRAVRDRWVEQARQFAEQ
jgi:predicted flap endonuclease-1-like 5' DNA nuclease